MSKPDNLFTRALNALIEGRTRSAERYVAQLERDYGKKRDRVNGR